MLEQSKDGSHASAAADAIRALTLNNNNNKDAVREAWALPLLVKLLSSVSRCSECLVCALHSHQYILCHLLLMSCDIIVATAQAMAYGK